VDGDGHEDVVVGAPFMGDKGAACVVLGEAVPSNRSLVDADAILTGEAEESSPQFAGNSVSGAGDVDADGYSDVLVGAEANDEGGDSAGAAYLVLGNAAIADRTLADADAKYVGEEERGKAGLPVSNTGDVDADGFDDVLVSSRASDLSDEDAGTVYLILGEASPSGRSLAGADVRFTGSEADDRLGGLAAAGDVNADGYADLLIGTGRHDAGGEDAGAAWLILGRGR
jgi:hypothetical protein